MALCDLYDRNAHLAGKQEPDGTVLIPLYHSTVTAQITVTIDGEGNFKKGEAVPDGEKLTIIPVTDSSASRTSSPSPHPLCDTLEYLAGDYGRYVSDKDCSEKHMLYMDQLEKWAFSPYSHKKVEALYRYLKKGTLMSDLVCGRVLLPDEDGKLSEKVKMQAASQTKAFVRFRIEDGQLPPSDMLEDTEGKYYGECWKDRTLQESYISWQRSQRDHPGLSYLTGEMQQISYLQPKKIRNEGDGAKLISSNDADNFTYRGRFVTREEAFAIGYEDSQKVHNALKWIIRKQGKSYGSMCLVTWESDLCKIPDWRKDTDSICVEVEEDGEVDFSQLTDIYEEKEPDTGELGAARFRRALAGYEKDLRQSSRTVIMAFDAATTGRLAMLECREYDSSRYLDALQRWYDRCEWIHEKAAKDKGHYTFTGMVGMGDIAELLYGTEQKGYFSLAGKEERYKDVAKRLLPCILDGSKVPVDMVSLAVRRASSPQSFESRFLWERVLTLACSFVKQQYIAERKENWTMALDVTCTKRDYLYGRLLAVADRIEYRTYDREENGQTNAKDRQTKGRQTNAKRYMSAFSQHPFRTWKVIEERLEPYLVRLAVPERLKYQGLLDEISDRFTVEDFASDMPLSGLYLLGFHNQAYAFKKKEEKEDE